VLLIILAVLLLVQNRHKTKEDGIIIKQNDKETVIGFSDIDKLQKQNFTTNREDNFSGFLLFDLLKGYDFSEIILHSSDGGNLRLDQKDIANAYIIEMKDSDETSFRLIIPSDEFGQRWMKYIKIIELQ
jgi:hypothetical protein